MRFAALGCLVFAVLVLATAPNERRQSPTSLAQLLSALSAKTSLTAAPTIATTMPTCLGGFDPPNPTLAQAILTALPASVIAELGNPNSRSSLASKIKAGQTPSWYMKLDPAIKSYVASVQTHATTGCSATPTPSYYVVAGQTLVANTGSGSSSGSSNSGGSNGVASSTSKAIAARPTAAPVGGISGALGILGLLFVL